MKSVLYSSLVIVLECIYGKVELYKQSLSRFIFSELIVFLSQVTIFFVVAVLTSDFLGSEEKLLAFSKQKINDGSFGELGGVVS